MELDELPDHKPIDFVAFGWVFLRANDKKW